MITEVFLQENCKCALPKGELDFFQRRPFTAEELSQEMGVAEDVVKELESVCRFEYVVKKYRLVSSVVTSLLEVWGSNPGSVKSNTVSPTARRCCNDSLEL